MNVEAVHSWVLATIQRHMCHAVVRGCICVAKMHHTLASIIISAIYKHGTCMEVPRSRMCTLTLHKVVYEPIF